MTLKTLSKLLPLLMSFSANAFICGGANTSIHTDDLYAEVTSLDHMTLELVIEANHSESLVITGGADYDFNNVPSCKSDQRAEIQWRTDNTGSHITFGQGGLITTYRICKYNQNKELIEEYKICNWETGD